MDMTIDQQVALYEALVPHAGRLRIGKSNFLLRSYITSKESTLQVVYDVLRLTPFYKAFLVTTDVPEIYMEMLHICPRIPNQTFDELLFEEEILSFLRYLGHSKEIKKITDGMYHKKNVDFAYLLWEDFVYQVEHKDAKKSNEMYYPRFTKVIINFFMTKDPSIPKRNKFGAMLPVELTNEDIRNSAAYKECYAIASRAAPPKMKASVRKMQSSSDTTMPSPTAAGTRLSTSAKGKQPAKSSKSKGLSVLSKVALSEGEQMKLATKRSMQQTHISQASGSGTDKGTGIIPGVPDVPTYESNEEISWKSNDEEDDDVDDQSDDNDDQEDEDKQDDDDHDDNDDDQNSDNNGDDFVHPKLSTHGEEAKDEKSFDPIVQTLSQVENSDDESNDDESHGMNVGGDEGPDIKDDDEELYRDVNINLEGRDVQMTDVYTTQVLEDTHVTLTLVNPDGQQHSSSVSSQFVMNMFNPSPDTSIDSLFESTPQVNVPVTTTVEPLLLTATTLPPPSIPTISQVQQAPAPSPTTAPIEPLLLTATTLPPPSIPTISQVQQAPAPSPTTAPSTFLQDLLNFSSLFGFDHRLKALEANFSEFMQVNQFARAVSSILDNKGASQDQVKVRVSKILLKIEKTVNEQLEAEFLTRSSNSSKTTYVVAADLSGLELKKILIEKMENNKSIHRSDEQRNLYKDLVDAYECDKIILDTYRDTVTLKRCRDDEDKDEEPFAGSDRGSKRRRAGAADDQPIAEASQNLKWFQKQKKPPTPDHAWNKTLPATHGSIQPLISDLAKQANSRTSFNKLMNTHVDFSVFLMNRLNVDTLTSKLLAGPTYELMKGSCKSLVELEFFLKEVYKATTDQLNWNNPKGQQFPHNLLKPLPLIPNS
nr:hypothetical protein [Tanacetum cinerariifolium]